MRRKDQFGDLCFFVSVLCALAYFTFAVVCLAQDNWGYSGIIVGSGPPVAPSGAGPLTVTISCSPTVGPATLTTACTSVPTGGAPPYAYTWCWGDSTPNSTQQNANHDFTAAGTGTITLTVTDSASPKATATQVKTVVATGTPYYVAKSGSDSNNGLTPSTPFLTLAKCQTAMRSGNKVCIVNDSGTYTLGANLVFTSTDNGELWIAGSGQAPTIDGASSFGLNIQGITNWSMEGFILNHQAAATNNCIVMVGTSITFRWNSIINPCSGNSIGSTFAGNGLPSGFIDSNTVTGQVGAGQIGAFAAALGDGLTISHNLINGAQSFGLEVTVGTTISNTVFDRNIVKNACSAQSDCGGIYLEDSTGAGMGNRITNNVISGTSLTAAQLTKQIYLDSNNGGAAGGSSNVTISGNLVTNGGTWAVFIHCGNHNTVTNNVFDVSSISSSSLSALVGYQDDSGCSGGTMTNNAFNHNVVYDSGAWTNMNQGFFWVSGQTGGDTLPVSSNNTYWSPTGNAPNPSGGVTDSSPTNANPGFTNPAANNYTMNNVPSGFTPLVTNQGPVNSPFVAAGSSF